MTDETQDSYSKAARRYDLLIGPLIKRLRTAGLELLPPAPGMAVLDVGCGTGVQLSVYQEAGCEVSCVDMSPAMLGVARRRLGDDADIREVDGTALPFSDDSFDLATVSFVLHEVPSKDRERIVEEMRRVTRPSGHLLVTDFIPGPHRSLKGRITRLGIVAIEFGAGSEHWTNHKAFMAAGGVPALAARHGLAVEKVHLAGGGTIGVYLLVAGAAS